MSDEAKNKENAGAQPVAEQKAKKNKKIRYMTLKEIEDAIEKTNKMQNGLYSCYAQELLKKKNHLKNIK